MKTTEQVLADWLTLWRVPHVGPKRFRQLLATLHSPSEVFAASRTTLKRLGLPEKAVEGIANSHALPVSVRDAVARDIRWASDPGQFILTLADPRYPVRLKEIPDAPPILFVKGQIDRLAETQVAIVGSRNPSKAGLENAYAFSKYLAQARCIPTSGLAMGIDTAAHKGALDGGGATIAVLGCGLDHIYPRQNLRLAEAICSNGALVSEFPLGVKPRPEYFPRRNRIISGLSVGVLVVEAALKSGSLITARMAVEQGREVFAIPGSIHNPLSKGCHSLIREGAKLVETATHITEELAYIDWGNPLEVTEKVSAHTPSETNNSGALTPPDLDGLDADETAVMRELGDDYISADQVVERTALSTQAVLNALVTLELQGLISAVPGGYVVVRAPECAI